MYKLKIDDFTWIYQETWVAGQTATLKSGEIGTSRETQPRSAESSKNRSYWNHKLVETLKL